MDKSTCSKLSLEDDMNNRPSSSSSLLSFQDWLKFRFSKYACTMSKIRQAIGPVACEITSSRVVFVDPPYPPEEPREGKSKLSMSAVTPGNDFFGHPKNHQKSTPQKTYFFGPFFSKPAKTTKKTLKMKVILGPSWGHFSSFFWVPFFCRFLANFR